MVKMTIRGSRHIVKVSTNMFEKGWYGGQWVRFVGNRTVDFATDTLYAGFLLWGWRLKDIDATPYDFIDTMSGSEFIPFNYENKSLNAYHQTAMIFDSGEMDFNLNTYDTTQVYSYHDSLYINNNSVLTNVNSGGPSVGLVIGTPQDNNNWLGVLLNINGK
jgi:hypothetical protein